MGEFIEISLFLCIASLNYFFLRMWHLLRGNWWRMSPTWKWPQDIRDLKRLAETAESEALRQKCSNTLKGLYITAGYMLFVAVLGYIVTKLGYYY